MTGNRKFQRRYQWQRILPFGLIWLVVGWFTLLSDALATGYQNVRPETDITLSPGIFLFASLAVFTVGILMGALEVFWLARRFQHLSFLRKISSKLGIYLLFMLAVNVVTFPLAAGLEAGDSPVSEVVLQKFANYMGSPTFLSTLLSLSFSILVSLLYSAVAEHLGHSVLLNFFTGRYHRPKEEDRIFMFLDLKASTSLAEAMGHQQYFKFLRDYYNQLSEAIIAHKGEVYQYIGDEIVLTWTAAAGLENAHCVQCYFAMRRALERARISFEKTYGHVPDFRAGIHMGPVTTGEIGALKKEIFYTGDVLNVTARIQQQCKAQGADLLVSETVVDALGPEYLQGATPLGEIALSGRKQPVGLYTLQMPIGPGSR